MGSTAIAQHARPAAILTADQIIGDCIVQAMPEDAHAAVISTLNTGQFNERYGNRMRAACGGSGSSHQGSRAIVHDASKLRAVLADSLIRARFSQNGPSDFISVAPLWHVAAIAGTGPGGAHRDQREFAVRESESKRFLSRFGECVAREAPEAVRALLLTEVRWQEEQALFHALQPQLASCLNNGASMRLGTDLVRESLAYNYYRLASAATAQPIEESQ